MVVGAVSIAILWVLHQSGHCTSKGWSTVQQNGIGECLSKVECPLFWLLFLRKAVSPEHSGPKFVPIEIMDGTTTSNEKTPLATQMTERNADLQMLMRVKVRV